MPDINAIKMYRDHLYNSALTALERLINATPTGPIREKLTEANIALMTAESEQAKKDNP